MSIADTEDSGKYWLYQYCRYWKILENTSYTSIADTGRFWKILVIPVLQILENSGKYWLYQYCRYWKIRYEVAECTFILGVFSTQKNRDIRHYGTWFVQLLLTLLQFSTQIFQTLQNVCTYNEGVHITE